MFVEVVLLKKRIATAVVLLGTTAVVGGLLVERAGAAPIRANARQTGEPETWKPRVEARGDELYVNGRLVLRFRESRYGLTPSSRIDITADRLRSAVNLGLTSADVRVDSGDPDNPTVRARGWVITTAPAEPNLEGVRRTRTRRARIRAARAEAHAQAARWANNLRRALAVPGLTVADSGQVVPLGETRRVRLAGAARGAITVTVAPEGDKTVGVAVDQESGAVTISGLEPGRRVLTFWREGAKASVYVAVRPYAANFHAPAPVTVTGGTAPADLIRRHALASAQLSVTPLPGAKLRLLNETPAARSLSRGRTTVVEVPFRVTGPEMLPVTRTVQVPVVNKTLPNVPAANLFYSNHPERVKKPATLFTAQLTPGQKVTRLLYHHQSAMTSAFRFVAELVNEGDSPARIHVSGSEAGPERDTVWVGFRAASDFVKAHQANVGVVVEVPARSRLALSSVRVPAGLTVSGLWQLRVLSGPAPLVRVAAEDPLSGAATIKPLMPVALKEKTGGESGNATAAVARFSEHVYPDPGRTVEGRYSVGGNWTFLPLGKVPLTGVNAPERQLFGNYGVFYDFVVLLENPTDRESKARVVFEPSAGMAGGIFLIGDTTGARTVEIPQSTPPQETTLASYALAPGEKRRVHIRTLPLSGSNYPANIILCP